MSKHSDETPEGRMIDREVMIVPLPEGEELGFCFYYSYDAEKQEGYMVEADLVGGRVFSYKDKIGLLRALADTIELEELLVNAADTEEDDDDDKGKGSN